MYNEFVSTLFSGRPFGQQQAQGMCRHRAVAVCAFEFEFGVNSPQALGKGAPTGRMTPTAGPAVGLWHDIGMKSMHGGRQVERF